MKISRTAAVIAAALMSVPATANAEDISYFEYEQNGVVFEYAIDGETGTASLISAENSEELVKLNIPETINGIKVTAIGSNAFAGCISLEEAVFPDSVTSVGSGAFMSCMSLKTVTAKGVSEVPEDCFFACPRLENAELSPALASIGDDAFFGCTELDMTLPETVTEIGSNALGFEADPHTGLIVSVYGFLIQGKTGSQAEKYAAESGIDFLDPDNYNAGDVDGNGKVDASDSSFVLVEYARLSTGFPAAFTKKQKILGDMNGDGKTDASDASDILVIYAELSTSVSPEK